MYANYAIWGGGLGGREDSPVVGIALIVAHAVGESILCCEG